MKKLRTVSLLLALAMCLAAAVPAASAVETTTIRLYDEHKTSKIEVKEGEPFGSALPVPSKSGKVFLGWYTNIGSMNFALGDYVDSSTVYDKSKHGTALYAMWSYGTDYLTVNLDPQGGTVQPTTAKAYQFYYDYNLEYRVDGVMFEELPVLVRPGYKFKGWCEDSKGMLNLYSSHTGMTFDFRDKDIKLYAIWEADGTATQPTQPDQPTQPTITFTDVPAGAWYADAVNWAVEKGIVNGTSPTTFSPTQTCTNAQIISTRDEVKERVLNGSKPSAEALENAEKVNAWLIGLDQVTDDRWISDLERNGSSLALSGY